MEFERLVTSQCEALIQLLHERREFLLDTIKMDKESKLRILKVSKSDDIALQITNFQIFPGTTSQLHRKAAANDWFNSILY